MSRGGPLPINMLYLPELLSEFNDVKCPERLGNATEGKKKPNGAVLVVDFGSWQCRAGWAGETEPSRKCAIISGP